MVLKENMWRDQRRKMSNIVYITKHALTKGICEMEVCDMSEDGASVFGKAWDEAYHGEGKEWHRTKEGAIKRAEEMRIKKIKLLEKQIEKLKALKFS